MKKTSRFILVCILLCIVLASVAAFFLRPVPDLDFLYINYPEIKGYIPASVIGTRVVYFLDPSFYYKFSATEADAVEIARTMKLEPVAASNFASPIYSPTQLFWHDWTWWHPNPANASRLFNAYLDGNDVYLLYDSQEQVIYITIQNT